MIEVVRISNLKGAEKFGNCVSCGKGSQESENYRMTFKNENGQGTSVTLCRDCLQLLDVKMQLAWGRR